MKGFYIEFYGTHNQDDDRQFSKVITDLREALRPAGFEVDAENVGFDYPVSEVATAVSGGAPTVTPGPPVEEPDHDVPDAEVLGTFEPEEDYPADDQAEPSEAVVVPPLPPGILWIMDPAHWSIDSLKVSIPAEYTESELRATLTLERHGKGRVGAVAVFENALDELIEGDQEPEPDDTEGYGYE